MEQGTAIAALNLIPLTWNPIRNPAMVPRQHYRQPSNISHTLVGDKSVDHSVVAGASPVGAAPTTSSFSTEHLGKDNCKTR